MKLVISDRAYERLQHNCYDDVLSVQDAQQILGICRVSIYKLIETNQLKAFRVGRTYMIPKQAIFEFLAREKDGGDEQ